MQKIVDDKDFGMVVMRKYQRSRAYTLRMRGNSIRISLPWRGSYAKALELLDTHRADLLLRRKQEVPSLEPGYDEEELKRKALAWLPRRLEELAGKHGFVYTRVKISRSRGRWGSCSSKASINLSLFLMLLPEHLIDYVLLHELCHTREMNHGPRFWKLMDEVTAGKSGLLRRELKTMRIPDL